MRILVCVVTFLCVAIPVFGGSIIVQNTNGDVSVRHGVTEEWVRVAAGDVLKPNDTMRTGKDGTASLMLRNDSTSASRRLSLPPMVIVDMSDIRVLTQEELMLKLTMEKVRSAPQQKKQDGLEISNAAVVHGTGGNSKGKTAENDPQIGSFLLNGTKVLLENGFSATGVLRMMQVFRLFPSLASVFDHRLLLAEAMEKANLKGEAIAEYGAMTRLEGLTSAQKALLQNRIAALRK